MTKDQVIGALLLIGSIAFAIAYFWLLFLAPPAWSELTIKLSALGAVSAICVILAWIGYTLATTPPPKPIEEIEKELEKGEA